MIMQFLTYALLGLGAGAIYGLLAQGLVVVYRGSGVLNFAQGAFAMVGAYLFYTFSVLLEWPVALAVVTVVVALATLGVGVQVLIMHPMRRAATLMRVIATLGLLITLQAVIEIRFGASTRLISSYLPTSSVNITDTMYIGADKLWILIISVVVTAVLWCVYRLTSFGRATEAVAEVPRVAAMLGHSPNRIAATNWAIGSGLAGLAGCLIAPITGLQTSDLSNLVIPAIAAAVLSRLRSFPGALAAGLLVGMIEAVVSRYVTAPGWGSAVPFLLILVLLVIRGTGLPLRGHLLQRLPEVSSGTFPRRYLVVLLILLLGVIQFAPAMWTTAVLFSALAAIVGLSVVVVTGYAGQISLAPYGMAAIGGLLAAQLSSRLHISLLPAMLIGAFAATVVGILVALPAIRTRGINLAIVTLGLGVVISDVVLANPQYSGGQDGIYIGDVTVFGSSVSSIVHLDRYAALVVLILVGLLLVTMNLRRGVSGRKMIAVRDNERAAASLGVKVASVKLTAFAVSSFIAAIGGVLIVFQFSTASFEYGFSNLSSITLVGLVVLGGLGYSSGAVFGSLLVAGGVFGQLLHDWSAIDNYLGLIGGLAIIVQLLTAPNGVMPENFAFAKVFSRRVARRFDLSRAPSKSDPVVGELVAGVSAAAHKRVVVRPMRLEVRGLRVAFGGAIAVDEIDFDVAPGEVVGLIGPNGAGKTTAIDAITGFVPAKGTITLDGRRIDRLRAEARAGLGVTRSFQSIELFEDLTVRDNLAVACEPWSVFGPLRDLFLPKGSALSDSARTAIIDFELEGVLDRKPGELSFAQRRLIGIARSVARGPSVLLLDEPGAGLDAHEIHELAALVRALADDWGMAVVLVEHHLDMIASTCDRLVVLDRGRILSEGSPQDMLADEQVRAAYTGARTGVR
ncbi:branched-chain amino acid ABC transporter permease/ATP-binding protein [Nocardia vinacea]|uniref:Branched-chain amino acid ABC transporter permease/ATP-binding protein n=1 Tax=Nocardia vinacea TaxID=96468 RepID=A0ABZ1YXW8_9NOCA|nr:branched-chain amino acid ABC transporter permease/ATP-binding protein [Nocardia vinacea]